jgi:hypothetical protein
MPPFTFFASAGVISCAALGIFWICVRFLVVLVLEFFGMILFLPSQAVNAARAAFDRVREAEMGAHYICEARPL